MEQPLVESDLLAILVTALICPFIAKKIEQNLEGPRFCQHILGWEGEGS